MWFLLIFFKRIDRSVFFLNYNRYDFKYKKQSMKTNFNSSKSNKPKPQTTEVA